MSCPGLLIVLSGPGGVGKDTLIEMLLPRDPRLRYSVSYTTRPRRPYEVPGEHYYFVDEPTFRRLVDEGLFLEHAVVNGYLYGTPESWVEMVRQEGRDVILKIDVQGAEQVRRRRPDALLIFISPPSMEELSRRRRRRGAETPEEMQARQRLAEVEMSYAERYDHVVVNDDAERAVGQVLAILEEERRRRRHCTGEEAREGGR
ncbi:MAG TPA: guanylate kinase [Candidatus Dormibacteraeota bacterium]|nr:guanylate kinase [Candidatus Dormibacteraeota bacterium]